MDKKIVAVAVSAAVLVLGGGGLYMAEKSLGEEINTKVSSEIERFNSSNKFLKAEVVSLESNLFSQNYKTKLKSSDTVLGDINFEISHGPLSVFTNSTKISGEVLVEKNFSTLLGLTDNKLATISGIASPNKFALSTDLVSIKIGPDGKIAQASPFKLGVSVSAENSSVGLSLKDLDLKLNPAGIMGVNGVESSTLNLKELSVNGKFTGEDLSLEKIVVDMPDISVSGIGAMHNTKLDLALDIKDDRVKKSLSLDVDKLDYYIKLAEGVPSKDIKVSLKSDADIPVIRGGVANLMNFQELLIPSDTSREFWTKGATYNLTKLQISYPGSKIDLSGNVKVDPAKAQGDFSFGKNATFTVNLFANGDIAKNYKATLEEISGGQIKIENDVKLTVSYKDGVATSTPTVDVVNSDVPKIINDLDVDFGYVQKPVVEEAPVQPDQATEQPTEEAPANVVAPNTTEVAAPPPQPQVVEQTPQTGK